MDAAHFDTLARYFSGSPTRRGALRLLVGAALGRVLGSWADDAVDAHDLSDKCKKKSGKAKRKCNKKARKHNAAHIAVPCLGLTDDTPCNGDGRCLNGVCNPKPTCGLSEDLLTGQICNMLTPETCCSGECVSSFFDICDTSAAGKPCVETKNCDANLVCVGYVCRPA